MRIIAGTARSRTIKTPDGMNTRPTLDRVRENIFNILQHQVREATVLDLFGGSGALAFEALSRGAAHAVICDHDRKAIECIRSNMQTLRFEDRTTILRGEWEANLRQLAGEKKYFSLVFLDPPYAMTDLTKVMEALLTLIDEDTIFMIEHQSDTVPTIPAEYEWTDHRRYGIAGVSFCRLRKGASM